MDFTIEALAAEIINDPDGVGYKNADSTWKNDQVIADMMNLASRTLPVSSIPAADVRAATTFDAFDGLTTAEESWFRWLTSGESITITPDTLAALSGIGGGSVWAAADRNAMEARMAAILQYQGSRAEELFGRGFQVSPSMVGQAANV